MLSCRPDQTRPNDQDDQDDLDDHDYQDDQDDHEYQEDQDDQDGNYNHTASRTHHEKKQTVDFWAIKLFQTPQPDIPPQPRW